MLSALNEAQETTGAGRASALQIGSDSLWRRRDRARRRRLNDPRLWLRLLLLLAAVWLFESAVGRPGPAGAADHDGATAPEKPDRGGSGTEAPLVDMVHPPAPEHGQAAEGGHGGPATDVFLAVLLILFLAKVGGDLAERLHLPAVLGELTVGVLLGNFLLLTGWHGVDFLQPETQTGGILQVLAEIGVVLLLFEVGLESQVREMLSVGLSSALVAILGVVAPICLGSGVSWLLLPEAGWPVHAFIGATLAATSVGITARVLKDLGKTKSSESRIILGAAVIDDVLGLIVLAVVTGVIGAQTQGSGGGELLWSLLKIVGLAVLFLGGALALGALQFPRRLFRAASFLYGRGLLVTTALVICFGFAFIAGWIGLAPIVGAFAAGLILERTHYRDLGEREDHELEEALTPLSTLFVPIFFVQMGILVDLRSFSDPSVWGLAAAITAAAIVGKQLCAWGVREKGVDRLAVGLGMIPRGEVGLIFANEGRRLMLDGERVINEGTYSAVVVMVMLTTMLTPPLLKWAFNRRKSPLPADDPIPKPALVK